MDATDRVRDTVLGTALADAALGGPTRLSAGPVSLAQAAAVRLGALSIEPDARRVAHDDGREEFLQPRVMQVLVALLRAEGRIVSREELFASCWPGVVVGEDALSRVIGRLRRLADDLGAEAFKLETITKVGYRLTPLASAGEGAAPDASIPPTVRERSICVLPFANMSDDPQQDYFSDGISEDIITDLSKVSSLFVVARTTAFTFRDRNIDVPRLASELSVGHVLEGSVRKAEGRVRITAQLIDGATGGHVWAERYDRDLKDIFALQDEISQAIVDALKLKLLPEEKEAITHRGTSNPDAYDLYLMARRYYIGAREGDIRSVEAIERLCRRAAEIDPGYARAWALMAEAQTMLHCNHARPGEKGLAAVERALALDSGLADAHAVLARQRMLQGQIDEAFAEIELALTLDPECWLANSEAGCLNYGQLRFADAIQHFEKATSLGRVPACDPGMLMSSYHALGDWDGVRRAARQTVARAERVLTRDHVNGAALGCAVGALAALGEAGRARDLMDRALLIDPNNAKMRYNFACGASAFLHDNDLAVELLTPVFEVSSAAELAHAKIDPDFTSLRDDPRFIALIAAAEARLAAATLAG
jgi:adenylate cyclase